MRGLTILVLVLHIVTVKSFPLDPLQVPRQRMAAASAGDWLLFAGGLNDANEPTKTLEFIHATPSWNTRHVGDLERTMEEHCAAGMIDSDGKIHFMIGAGRQGEEASADFEEWIIENDVPKKKEIHIDLSNGLINPSAIGKKQWMILAGGDQVIGWNVDENKLVSLLSLDEEELSYAAVAEAGDLVVFAGGRRKDDAPSNMLVLVDCSYETPKAEPHRLIEARAFVSVGLVDKNLIIAGGINDAKEIVSTVHHYILPSSIEQPLDDPEERESLTRPRAAMTAICGAADCLFVGGVISVEEPLACADDVDIYFLQEKETRFGTHVVRYLDKNVCEMSVVKGPDGSVVFAGGSADGEVFKNIEVWGSVVRYESLSLDVPRSHLAAASWNGFAYFAGGLDLAHDEVTDVIDRYDANIHELKNKWGSLKEARQDLCGAAGEGIVLFAGGRNGASPTPVVDIIHTEDGSIEQRELSVGRWSLACAGAGDYIIFTGGLCVVLDAGFVRLTSCSIDVDTVSPVIDIFEISTRSFLDPKDFEQRGSHGIFGLPSHFCVFGGSSPVDGGTVNDSGYLDTMQCADGLEVGQVESKLSVARSNVSVALSLIPETARKKRAAVQSYDDKSTIYVIGGTEEGQVSSVVDVIDLETKELKSFLLPSPLSGTAATFSSRSQKIVAAGGTTDPDNASAMMFIVDRSFRAFSSLAKPRQFHAGVAVEIEDSAFYVFVGGDEGGVLEVYGEKVVPPSEPPSTAPPTTTPQPTITLPPTSTSPPTTTPQPTITPPPSSCANPAPTPQSICVGDTWHIPNSNPEVITIQNKTQVTGTVVLGSGTITIISLPPNTFIAPVIVTGSITLDGSLEINLGGAGQNGQIIPVFSGSGEINGTFHSIDVKSTVACQRITGALVQTGTNTYGILLTVDNSGCKKKSLPPGAIAGIALGSICFLTAAILLGLYLLQKLRPGTSIFRVGPRLRRPPVA